MLSRWRIPMRLGSSAMPLPPPGSDPARTMDDDLVQLATLDRLGTKRRGSASTSRRSGRTYPEVTLEYLCDNIWIVGSPDTVATKLARLAEDVGGFGTLLVIAHEWTPRGAWERSMRLLKEEVVPRLSRAGSSRSRAAGRGSSRSPRRPRRGRAR